MKKRKTKNNVIKKNKNKIKPEYICRKNMMKRIKTPGNKEFTQSIFHNPGFKNHRLPIFLCVTISQKAKANRQ